MIGGIFETIGKTLGVGKEKYFLELDDAAENSVKSLKKSATKAAKSAKKTAKEVSTDVAEKAQSVAEDVKKETADAAKTVVDSKKTAKGKKAKAEALKEKAAKQAVAKTKAAGNLADGAAPEAIAESDSGAPANAKPAAPTAEELIVNAIAATSSRKTTDAQGNPAEGPKTFSTDYLMTPSRASRRRPGPSFGGFQDMAKEVNPRLKG